jgi:hypothetical protein
MAEVHADWRMTPAEWEELRGVLWTLSSPGPYVQRLRAEGKLGPQVTRVPSCSRCNYDTHRCRAAG